MKITREAFKNIVREVMTEESEYQEFFKRALEKTGKSIPDMSDEEKKAFFNKIDAAWQGKGEKNEELVGNQAKLDVDGDGEIEASDLAALRAGKKVNEAANLKTIAMLFQNKGIKDAVRKDHADKLRKIIEDAGISTKGVSDSELVKAVSKLTNESVNEATLEKGTKLRYEKNTFVVDYVVDKKYTGRDGFPKYILKVVKSNYPNKIKVGSTIEYDDARLTGLIRNRVMSFVKNESVNEGWAPGPYVGLEMTPTGPKLVKTFKSGNEAYAWVMKSGGGHSIMTKKQWNVSESVKEGKLSNTWQKNNKKGYVLKVGNIELKSAGPTNTHDILVNRQPWGTFHMDYESGGTDFWVKPMRGNDFWVKEIDDIVKKVKADPRFKESVNEEILKPGTKVKVQHKGKTVSGKIVRYDGKTPGSPFYVVYTGQYDSIEVPAYQVKKESVVKESINEAGGTVKNPKTGKDIKISTALSYGKSHPAYKAAAAASQQARPVGGAPGVKPKPPVNAKPAMGTKVTSPAPTNAKPAMGTKVTSAPPRNAQPPVGTKVTGPPPGVRPKPPVVAPPSAKPAGTPPGVRPKPPVIKPSAAPTGATKAPLGPPPGVKAKPPVIAPPSAVKKPLGPPPGVKPKGAVPPPPPPPPPPSGKPSVGTPPGVKAKPPVIAPPSATKAPLGPPPGVRPKGAVPPPPPPPPPPTKSKFEDKESVKEKKKIKK